MTQPLERRFWSRVKKADNGCWHWTGATNSHGYGRLNVNCRVVAAHRVAWELQRGPIVGTAHILHRCDNRLCVRADHLFLGTNAENMADMARKGRQGSRKLTAAQVVEMRQRYADGQATYRQLAAEYGIVRSGVWKILTGRRWRHIDQGRAG